MSPKRKTSTRRRRSTRITPLNAIIVLVLLIAGAYLSGDLPDLDLPTVPRPVVTATAPSGDSPFQVYFTDPYAPGAATRTGGPDGPILAALDSAQKTIDIAIYNFSLENLAEALLRAQDRGVRVRLVMESDAIDGTVPQYLLENDIQILGDRKESLMHNKFIIIDGLEVWVGSLNLTPTGTYKDHNHMVRLRSNRVAQNYTTEFEEMFVSDLFSSTSPANTPFPQVTVDGRKVEVMFSPDDGISRRLVDLVNSAQSSVHFLAYSFTSDDIADAMLARARAGVPVRGVFEEAQVKSNQGTEWDRMRAAGLDVRLDGISGQMHHKVIVVDGQVVSLGSYNFSANAEKRNDENIMIIHDPELAAHFIAEFERIYGRGKVE